MTSNGTNLLLKPLVSLTIGDANKTFILHVGEDLSKDTAMDIMYEVNRTANNSTEEFEESAYVGTVSKAGIEVMDELACEDLGYQAKRLKNFVPPKNLNHCRSCDVNVCFPYTVTFEPQCRGDFWIPG